MKFDYIKQASSIDPARPWIPRPIIPIRLINKAMDVDLYALIDSGADASLFHAELAKDLLIDLESGHKQELFGVSGHPIVVYFHEVKLQIIGSKDTIILNAGFTESTSIPALLGQADFFKQYKITFERAKEQIEINPPAKK